MPKNKKGTGKWDEVKTKGSGKESKLSHSTRKSGTVNASEDNTLTDVSLDDYANNSKASLRVRKVAVKKAIDIAANSDGQETTVLEEGVNDEEVAVTKTRKQKKKKAVDEVSDEEAAYYPLEFWFLVGRFVKPEDVLLFASICRNSHYVTRTFEFWKHMYQRNYDAGIELPARLQPECILRPWCLRACVVRSLFRMYPPFQQRLLNRNISSNDLNSLIPNKCIYLFPLQTKNKWQFIFKFHRDGFLNSACLKLQQQSFVSFDDYANMDEIIDNTDDVMTNPEEGSRVLSITSSHFSQVPPTVMGCYLVEAKTLLSRDLLRQRLRLVFSSSPFHSKHGRSKGIVSGNAGGFGEVIEFDSVEMVQVLPWWYPSYPVTHHFH